MAVDLKTIPLAELNETFHLENGVLIRTRNHNPAPLEIVKMNVDGNNDQFSTNRLIYALKNQLSDFGYLVLDDEGEHVAVSKTVFQLYNRRAAPNVSLLSWSRKDPDNKQSWIVKITLDTDTYLDKVFDSRRQALRFVDKTMKEVWGEEFNELNIYKTMFGD